VVIVAGQWLAIGSASRWGLRAHRFRSAAFRLAKNRGRMPLQTRALTRPRGAVSDPGSGAGLWPRPFFHHSPPGWPWTYILEELPQTRRDIRIMRRANLLPPFATVAWTRLLGRAGSGPFWLRSWVR